VYHKNGELVIKPEKNHLLNLPHPEEYEIECDICKRKGGK
jgi:hypothetical protein